MRANDTRLTPLSAACEPEHAVAAGSRHTITLDKELLRNLCTPVRIHPLGELLRNVALAWTDVPEPHARRSVGRFRTTFHTPGGVGGKPRPVLKTNHRWLDASATFCEPADPAWGWTAKPLPWRLPDDLSPRARVRVPVHCDRTRAFDDTADLHPEHPPVDRAAARSSRTYKLPPPSPDHVPYKWKDGEYLGYDWGNPLAKANHERLERERARRRARQATPRRGRRRRRLTQPRRRLARVPRLALALSRLRAAGPKTLPSTPAAQPRARRRHPD